MSGYDAVSCCAQHPTALCCTDGFLCLQKWMRDGTARKRSNIDKLGQVDFSIIKYPAFRRNIYTEALDLSRMSQKEVAEYRSQLDNLQVRGFDVPWPVQTWFQCGLSGRVLDILKRDGFDKPMPIQVISVSLTLKVADFGRGWLDQRLSLTSPPVTTGPGFTPASHHAVMSSANVCSWLYHKTQSA